ncbi:hypothetical protein RFI_14938 [Reticulomyxa filosa]|uniref:Uncharacterized protein n=1 Tax=Reticulomyxa filosa TaxID=46433 RepID=X6NAC4_RETFI|nr:hypothetical protein RFI_14938 [Reticulomyxa filosa]|eukprot:ETO22262.1 hypothetical protein RFI_14938 [Reticulomyxa filosa]
MITRFTKRNSYQTVATNEELQICCRLFEDIKWNPKEATIYYLNQLEDDTLYNTFKFSREWVSSLRYSNKVQKRFKVIFQKSVKEMGVTMKKLLQIAFGFHYNRWSLTQEGLPFNTVNILEIVALVSSDEFTEIEIFLSSFLSPTDTEIKDKYLDIQRVLHARSSN